MQQIKTTRTAPLPFAPVPKAYTRFIELSDAELAGFARRIARLDSEIARLQSRINELRREQGQVIGEIRLGTSMGIIEECSFCHGHHEGPCNN